MAKFFFFKDTLKIEPSTATLIAGLTQTLPWSVKPLYGLLTDALPICGKRRKSYIIIGAVSGAMSWIALALLTTELWHAAIFLTIGAISGAIVNVCAEAVTVECSSGRSFGRAATLQSWQWGTGNASSLLGAIIGGYGLDLLGHKYIFLLTGIVVLIQVPAAIYAEEPDCPENRSSGELVTEWWVTLKNAVQHDQTFKCLIFIFILFSTPTNGDASSYFYTNELGMSASTLATVGILGQGAGLLGIFLYQKYCRHIGVRYMLFWSTLVGCILSLLGIMLYTRANVSLGIPDVPFLITDSTISIIVSQVGSMPIFALVAILCPEGVEATIFSLFTSVMNFGSLVGNQIGGILVYLFGITSTDFTLLWLLVLLTSLLQLYPMVFLFLIPAGTTKNMKAVETPAYRAVSNQEV